MSCFVGTRNLTQVLWKNSQPLLLTTKASLQAQILVFDHGCITDSFQANLLSINRPNAICLWECSEVSEGWFPSSLPGQVSFPCFPIAPVVTHPSLSVLASFLSSQHLHIPARAPAERILQECTALLAASLYSVI